MCPLKDDLKAEAQRLGFSLCGITTPDQPDHFQQYQEWVQANRHADMAYLAREDSINQRANPNLILPEAKSVIVLGACYPFITYQNTSTNPFQGQVSSYAWSADYHLVIKEKALRLVDWVKKFSHQPIQARICIDSAPVLERSLAWRAGLGWIGKNGCLIHPRLGSFFFLAEIFVNVELSPDEPFSRDLCGNCHRCIDACSTNCILPNRTIDARRCLSYLTIENRGNIPRNLRPSMGSHIFGCDICQQVCPWNQKAHRNEISEFSLFLSLPLDISLVDAVEITKDEFSNTYQSSPIYRAHYEGFLRNIIVAMGNSTDESVIPALQKVLIHPEPLIRSHAAWALGQFESAEARHSLRRALLVEQDPNVQEELMLALNKKTLTGT